MSIAVVLPSLGESVVEGTISQWLVKEGDRVERDQPLVEVTTDKVDVEIPSPATGVVQRIVASAGEVVPVGAELARIDSRSHANREGSAPRALQSAADSPPPAASADAEQRPTRTRTTPVARQVAEALDVDPASASASGPGGRITKRDILREAERSNTHPEAERSNPHSETERPSPQPAAERPSPQSEALTPMVRAATAPPGVEDGHPATLPSFSNYEVQEGDRVIRMSPLRRLVAEHMVYSKNTSPHVGTVAEIDLGRVVALRDTNKSAFRDAHGFSLNFVPFLVHATARALREYPSLNASVLEDAIVEKAGLHIGIAVETGKGLVVPVVRHADRLSVVGIAEAIEDLASRARSKRLSADELKGGTFTISNPGKQGNLYGFAIINQPQVGILRMGEIVKRPVVCSVDGADAIAIRPTLHLALSYDHRAVDGAPANQFLHRVRELLERAEFDL
jgi:2-oxoglutarate dehydrogenase E2 component (dihydrolipoamide succinyltransferase)